MSIAAKNDLKVNHNPSRGAPCVSAVRPASARGLRGARLEADAMHSLMLPPLIRGDADFLDVQVLVLGSGGRGQ